MGKAAFRRCTAPAVWAGALCALLVTSVVASQRLAGRITPPGMPRGGGYGTRFGLNGPLTIDGGFQFCRVAFRQSVGGDGGNWSVDYPEADQNFSTRLSELTKTSISRNDRGDPNHVIVRLTDPELYHCPFVMMTEVGSIFLDDDETENLRNYLLKGGFLWADDFWGTLAWDIWENQLRKVLPSGVYPIVDVPLEHLIFTTVFSVKKFPQIPSIGAWGGPGGRTSERGRDSAVPNLRAVYDEHGRLMVLISHNTDFGDSWEREAYDPNYFREFSVDGYAFGINAIIYSMTH
jgi:hypothetical protein